MALREEGAASRGMRAARGAGKGRVEALQSTAGRSPAGTECHPHGTPVPPGPQLGVDIRVILSGSADICVTCRSSHSTRAHGHSGKSLHQKSVSGGTLQRRVSRACPRVLPPGRPFLWGRDGLGASLESQGQVSTQGRAPGKKDSSTEPKGHRDLGGPAEGVGRCGLDGPRVLMQGPAAPEKQQRWPGRWSTGRGPHQLLQGQWLSSLLGSRLLHRGSGAGTGSEVSCPSQGSSEWQTPPGFSLTFLCGLGKGP